MKLDIQKSKFTKVSEIVIPSVFYNRMKTGIEEFDAMFGEGILPGSAFTITAQAGCGKTTLLLQLMEALANNGYEVGYASGEENQYQLAFTCKRLNVKSVQIANETDVDVLAKAMQELDILVVDSFQALTTKHKLNHAELERYAVSTLVNAAKRTECTVVFVMHLTKNGSLKGSTLVPHAVDVNVQIMMDDEGDEQDRIISFYKNRFGPTLDYTASMTSQGFKLSGRREVVKAPPKAARKKSIETKIMAMDPPNITKKRIMKDLALSGSQAYLALKEMTDAGKLVKYGRGDDAVFKRVKVG